MIGFIARLTTRGARSGVQRRAKGFAALLLAAALFPAATLAAPPPQLLTDVPLAEAGYFRLSWQFDGPGVASFELQEAPSEQFASATAVYSGPDEARVLSGRGDGVYWFRVRARLADGFTPWSEPVKVEVAHHPLSRAVAFFATGAVVFVATLIVIVLGSRQANTQA